MPIDVIKPPDSIEDIPDHAGDVTGDHANTVVSGIQGVPINATPPDTDGQTWVWDSVAEEFVVGTPDSDSPDHAGDVVGDHNNTVVVGLRGIPISSDPPSINDYLVFNGTEYAPTALGDTGVERYYQITYEFEIAASQGSGWYRPQLATAGGGISGLNGQYNQVSGGTITSPASIVPTAQDGLLLTLPSPYLLDAVTVQHDGNVIGNSNWGIGLFDQSLTEIGYLTGASGSALALYKSSNLALDHADQFIVPMIWVDATSSNGLFGRITLRFKA